MTDPSIMRKSFKLHSLFFVEHEMLCLACSCKSSHGNHYTWKFSLEQSIALVSN